MKNAADSFRKGLSLDRAGSHTGNELFLYKEEQYDYREGAQDSSSRQQAPLDLVLPDHVLQSDRNGTDPAVCQDSCVQVFIPGGNKYVYAG